jgi:hypothetical protein
MGAFLLVGSATACAPAREMDPTERTGAAPQAQSVYCVLDASTDVGTVHFQGPDWLLTSSEVVGPLELNVRVLQYLQPAMSTSIDVELDPSTISNAVGYSVQHRYGIEDRTRLSVDAGRFQRVEAYADYQRTVFDVLDAGCSTFLDTGAAYRPIGVYFKAVYAEDVCLPDIGVHVCVQVPGVPPPSEEPGDAGG